VAVDVLALSPQARTFPVVLNASPAAPLVVQNTAKTLTFASGLTSGFKINSIYVNFEIVPVVSGGTSTLKVERIATDGSTATSVVAAADILSGYTAKIPVAQTLAAANPTAITAGESVMVTITTSNHSVGTADAGASVTLWCEAVEDSVISDTNATV
jgi:hypothetical protein